MIMAWGKEKFRNMYKRTWESLKIIENNYYELDHDYQMLGKALLEIKEYLTSYESIETIQQCEHSGNNKNLDEKTINEMTRRYLIVHDKVLKIIDEALDLESQV